MKYYGVFFNPNAGNGRSEETANQLKEELIKHQIEVEFLTAPSEEQGIERIISSIDTLDALIAIGGDGTLNCVGTAFIRKGKSIPLGVIPGGTINNFAKRWDIPLNIEEAIEVISVGETRKVSIGKCDNRAIISSFTFGRLADISNDVRQSEKQKYGLVVYPYQALKHIGKNKSYLIRYKTDREVKELKTWITLVTTTSYVGGLPYTIHDANAFHVSILNNMSISKMMTYLRYAFTGELKKGKAVTYIETEKLEIINMDRELDIQSRIDGDKGPSLPLTLEWKKDFLDLMIPVKKG